MYKNKRANQHCHIFHVFGISTEIDIGHCRGRNHFSKRRRTNMLQNVSLELPINNMSAVPEYSKGHNSTVQDCLGRDSSVEVLFKSMAYIFILLVSLIGNLLVLMVIYTNRQLRTSLNYFVLNMAVSDLFTPLTIMPIRIVQIISGSTSWKVDSPWILGNILCKLCYFLPDVSLVVSIESLLLISMDRLVAVVFPLRAKLITPKARFICIGCTWITAIAVHAPYFYTFRLFSDNDNTTYCRSSWAPAFDHVETHKRFFTATFIIFLLVPICLLAIVYVTIAWKLKTNIKNTERRLSCVQRHRAREVRGTIRMSVAIIMAFVLCMIPLLVYLFTLVFLWNWNAQPICAFHDVIPFISLFMLNAWSAVNPCICLTCIKIYRSSLGRILPLREMSKAGNRPTVTSCYTLNRATSVRKHR